MKTFEGSNLLSESEMRAYNMMQHVHPKTSYSHAIKDAYENPSPEKIRQIIRELKSQALLNTRAMQKILGRAFKPIIYS